MKKEKKLKYPDDFINKVICGDCLEVMKYIPDNSIDTIITDPPYALGFMGKAWDKFPSNVGPKKPFANQSKEQKLGGSAYQEWTEHWAKEALRVAKPGATLLCFGGTRTFHRLACAIEDAGWVIKDTLMWLYGSGFPKATDISKQIDKKAGKERKVVGKKENIHSWKTDKHRAWQSKSKSDYEKVSQITEPATPEAKLWNGWKSHGLKPAYEPIIMAMKPNDGTYANNALKWGVAGLNIDRGRIEYKGKSDIPPQIAQNKRNINSREMYGGNSYFKSKTKAVIGGTIKGRFPANILLDKESAKILDEQSGVSKSMGGRIGKKDKSNIDFGLSGKYQKGDPGFGDTGGASRFFYVAKASKRERNIGGIENRHPTVKPLKLLEYLCILTKTPTGGIVLDPFLGSGTTAMATKKTGRDFIGIEKEKGYCEIARARIKAVQSPLNL